ncbi:MAG: (2Fe-2S)-binding protein, partial [Promethearchaeota archaeon]
KECLGCGKCVAVCPGLAVVLLDYRKNKEYPLVTLPLELTNKRLQKGEKVIAVSNEMELGEFEVHRTRILPEFPKTQLITVRLPSDIAKQVVAIKLLKSTYYEPIESYHPSFTDDETIVCRCERVSVGEIRKWIRSGVRDFNELKALTKAGMGACGAKTCTPLIEQIFREEGIPPEEITAGNKRPIFIEVPMGIFANVQNKREY